MCKLGIPDSAGITGKTLGHIVKLPAAMTHACWKSPSRVDVSKDQRVNQVRLANYANDYLVNDWKY